MPDLILLNIFIFAWMPSVYIWHLYLIYFGFTMESAVSALKMKNIKILPKYQQECEECELMIFWIIFRIFILIYMPSIYIYPLQLVPDQLTMILQSFFGGQKVHWKVIGICAFLCIFARIFIFDNWQYIWYPSSIYSPRKTLPDDTRKPLPNDTWFLLLNFAIEKWLELCIFVHFCRDIYFW